MNPESFAPLLRRMTPRDLDRVIEIEHRAYPHPWTRGIFSDCLRVGYDCWCLQVDGAVLGYCVLSHAAGETHLLNLCVAPDAQGQGLGATLLGHALRRSARQGSAEVFLEVRPSNGAAIALYRRYGFRPVGERPDYYAAGEGRENALIMARSLARDAV
ncbi:MAG: ribosomal protein S18-alanine N-acetyltransferase [Xanthomonadales bacterium]